MASSTNEVFMKLSRRAEVNERSKLVATFVDVGPLFTLLSSLDHQIMYGRRGTGKTHALSYLAEIVENKGDAAIYIDMRNIGSSGGIYSDESIQTSERATRLLLDTLAALHSGLFEYMVGRAEALDLSRTGPLLDRFADAITEVRVVGEVEKQETSIQNLESAESLSASAGADLSKGLKADIGASSTSKHSQQLQQSITESGTAHHTVNFGAVGSTLSDLAHAMHPKRIWILLDEWSHVPLDLQPYLADLLRRSVLSIHGVTVKIAAIEQRSNFRILTDRGHYIGLELGADIAADVNLDDFMVFDNDAERAKEFFQELFFKHYQATEGVDPKQGPQWSGQLVQQAFTQQNVFDEFVRAAEGVPRDAINILALAAQAALDRRVSVEDIRRGAKNWYQRDKAAAVSANNNAQTLLHWIIDEVIGQRRARAFLLQSDRRHSLIDHLFDARVLHILKRNISAHDQPGVRYDAYKLDYGCYVDLINTSRATQGLLPFDDLLGENTEKFIDVPPDDYRSIRRAILDLEHFSEAQKAERKAA
jgi:hypothetical protein